VRGHAQWNAMKDKVLTAPRIASYNRQHRALYQALRIRDGEAAVRVISDHLDEARRDLLAT
jgi:DNA-binding GntR family transcriptional regulator